MSQWVIKLKAGNVETSPLRIPFVTPSHPMPIPLHRMDDEKVSRVNDRVMARDKNNLNFMDCVWQYPPGWSILLLSLGLTIVIIGQGVKTKQLAWVPFQRSLSLRMSHQLHSSSSGGRAARPSSLFLIATEPLTLWKCVPTEIMTNGRPSLSAFVQLYYLPQLGTFTRPPSLAKLY